MSRPFDGKSSDLPAARSYTAGRSTGFVLTLVGNADAADVYRDGVLIGVAKRQPGTNSLLLPPIPPKEEPDVH